MSRTGSLKRLVILMDESRRKAAVESPVSYLTAIQWRYLKVPQEQFEQLQAATLADLVVTTRNGASQCRRLSAPPAFTGAAPPL
jgi:hypothetical protein